jgi:hypothetical protein
MKLFTIFNVTRNDYETSNLPHDEKFFEIIVEIDSEERAHIKMQRAKQICDDYCKMNELHTSSVFCKITNKMSRCRAIYEKRFINEYSHAEQIPQRAFLTDSETKLYIA